MDIRSLLLFQHLANSLHFGHTADAMYVSPSTLSRVIQRLEEDCGVPLFVRDKRTVRLTAAGQRMREFCDLTLDNWQQLKADLDQQQQLLQGEISLYCSVTASQSYLPKLLSRFRQLHPQVEFKLTTGDPNLSVQKIAENQVDVSICIYSPDLSSDLRFMSLDRIPLWLISSKDSKITRPEQVDWRKHSVILPESGPSKRIVHHWFAEHNIRPRVYATVGGNEAIVSMVALDCGIGIVPQVVLDNSMLGQKVNRMRLSDIESYQIGLCCQRKRENEALISALFNCWQDGPVVDQRPDN